jgi:endonuclease/exonuclease/phosphatase (EEP) superfamily protein YafD
MQWRRRSRSELYETRFGRARLLVSGFWDVVSWAYLLTLVVVIVSRTIGGNAPTVLQPLQATLPILFIPAWIVCLFALLTKRWAQAIGALMVVLVHWFAIAPARVKHPKPFWAVAAPSIRIATANLPREPEPLGNTLQTLVDSDADVIVMVEFTPEAETLVLSEAIAAKYPFRVFVSRAGSTGAGILSKYAFDDRQQVGNDDLPAVRVQTPSGEGVRIVAVHPLAPLATRDAPRWDNDLKEFGRYAANLSIDEPLVFIGDFNGTRWQPPFGHLLAGPLRDAHESVGKGLSRSWPMNNKFLPPVARLDHAVYNERLYPLAVEDLNDSSNDHRPFVVDFAIQPLPR